MNGKLRRGVFSPFHRGILFLAVAVFGCSEATVGPVQEGGPEFKGFTYTAFAADGFFQGGQRGAVAELKAQVLNSWIALAVFEYQSSATSDDIAPNTTGVNPLTGTAWPTSSTPNDLREGVRQARAAQLKIMLKPQVDLYTGEWRAAIRPGAGGQWFRAYTAMLLSYARLADELHIEMLCIGTEYIVATQGQYTADWRELIAAVRQQYSGRLVYAANWSGASAYGVDRPEYQQIGFWRDLDYVGVDAYFPLTSAAADPPPPYDAAVATVSFLAQGIARTASLSGRQAIITETGLQSVRGALAAPWEYALGAAAGAVEDTAAQALYYRVMIGAVGQEPWCAGIFWWNWESVPSPNAPTNYTPRNKPAAAVLRDWYGGPVLLAAGKSVLPGG